MKKRIVSLLLALISGASALVFGFIFIACTEPCSGLFTILLAAWTVFLILKTAKPKGKGFVLMFLTAALLTAALMFNMFLPGYTSKNVHKFKIQALYTKLTENLINTDIIPSKLPKNIQDYEMFFRTGYMQGAGSWTLHFCCDEKTAAEYEDNYSKQAIYTIPLNEFGEQVGTIASKVESYDYDKKLSVFYDRDFWKGYENTAVIYVLTARLDWNHPHSTAVITDSKNGRVEFSSLG